MTEWTPLSEIIERHEADPAMAERLREARKRLAPRIFPVGSPDYERMMRGEGPRESHDGQTSLPA